MAAIDNKHLIEIISINVRSGVARASGRPYEIHEAQCVIHGPDGAKAVGQLNLPKLLADSTKPGRYLAEFELAVSMDRMVVPRVTVLHVHSTPAAVPIPPLAKA